MLLLFNGRTKLSCLEFNCCLVIYSVLFCVITVMKLSILVLCLAFAFSFGKFRVFHYVFLFKFTVMLQLSFHSIFVGLYVSESILKVLMAS